MIHLIHPTTHRTCTCETGAAAERAEARGFERTTHEGWREYRRYNDLRRLDQLRAEDGGVSQSLQPAAPAMPPPGDPWFRLRLVNEERGGRG